jgi:hypothetical protein
MILIIEIIFLFSHFTNTELKYHEHFFFQATAISDRPKAKPTKTQGKNNRKAYQPVQQQLQQSQQQQQQLGQHFHPFPYSHELPQQVLTELTTLQPLLRLNASKCDDGYLV